MRDGRLLVSAVLLSAGVAAAVAAATVRIAAPEGPQFASVRLAEITASVTTPCSTAPNTV